MKKTLATAAVLAIAVTGTAWASSNNTATVNDLYGSFNEATINQVVSSDWNTAVITQGGFSNRAQTDQEDTSYSFASITQYGDNNEGDIDQVLNTEGSEAYIYSDGTENTVYIYQHVFNGWAYASITQYGFQNNATILQQDGDFAESSIWQSGSLNLALIDNYWSDFAIAEIIQSGQLNDATIDQDASDGAEAYIDQNGAENFAFIHQNTENYGYSPFEGTQAFITQDGSFNDAFIYQGYFGGVANNFANIFQDGNSDYAQVDQTNSSNGYVDIYMCWCSWENDVFVTQVGDGNYATAWTHWGPYNLIDIYQEGTGNTANAGVDVGLGYNQDNYISVMQMGDYNFAQANVSGLSNDVYVTQYDTFNVANAFAYGDNNLVTINQGTP